MDKEKLIELASCLEKAGYKIDALKERNSIDPDSWVIEIIPLNPFCGKN